MTHWTKTPPKFFGRSYWCSPTIELAELEAAQRDEGFSLGDILHEVVTLNDRGVWRCGDPEPYAASQFEWWPVPIEDPPVGDDVYTVLEIDRSTIVGLQEKLAELRALNIDGLFGRDREPLLDVRVPMMCRGCELTTTRKAEGDKCDAFHELVFAVTPQGTLGDLVRVEAMMWENRKPEPHGAPPVIDWSEE